MLLLYMLCFLLNALTMPLIFVMVSKLFCALCSLLLKFTWVNLVRDSWMDLSNYLIFECQKCKMPVCSTRPHPKVERVVGVCFQPGLQPAKVVSASQAGDIQFLDMRNLKEAYLTIDAHRGSLTSLAVHRHAPLIASGSSKQLIKVFNLEGQQLGTIRYLSTFMAQKIGSVRCLTFHPYQVLLAAGATDACVSIYADEISPLT
ncbi:hypothetical protein MTR67_045190 [Solanum verrucosum]|uniref:Regulatory-associated protein of TOR 1-like n=1 Tax=Solanum verrucosum TaxID=315347 RepID=A0AAF0US78_SOLVR|nr:hypothetical protein MTR67_045190 [Solanum verrucosum]